MHDDTHPEVRTLLTEGSTKREAVSATDATGLQPITAFREPGEDFVLVDATAPRSAAGILLFKSVTA